MADGTKNQEIGSKEEERKERLRKSKRDWYHRNKHWLLEERAEKAAKARRARRRAKAKEERNRPVDPFKGPTEAQRGPSENFRSFRRRIKRQLGEMGWVVVRLNLQAKYSQERIHELLGGIVSKTEIRDWCAKGRELAKLIPLD